MTFIKAAVIAFSMYSKIPMPQFEWQEKEMKYALCFFPWVGAVIGAFTMGWWYLSGRFGIGVLARTAVGTAIPLFVTGGFHVDGFMDTLDAFHSYRERERKLEILKDSHIGAFSVIGLLFYYLIYMGAYSELKNGSVPLLAAGFFVSRALSGIGVVSIPAAKESGLFHLFSGSAHVRAVKTSLLLQLIFAAAYMIYHSPAAGIAEMLGALAAYFYYRHRTIKELGGATGDTAGYFLCLCEGVTAVVLAVCGTAGIVC